MTLGIDVARLFSEMILACNTKDLVVKKMVYQYLSTYAQSNPEITLLAINTLQKDWYAARAGASSRATDAHSCLVQP
jgi:vesicle coat complex subunit